MGGKMLILGKGLFQCRQQAEFAPGRWDFGCCHCGNRKQGNDKGAAEKEEEL